MSEEVATPAPVAPESKEEKKDEFKKDELELKLPGRMERPDKDKFERKKSLCESEIEELKQKREKLFSSIQDGQAGGSGAREARAPLLTQMKELTTIAKELRKQKDELFNKRNAIFDAQKKERDFVRGLRDSLDKYKSLEDVENAMRAMEYKQSTSAMTLNEEKAMMKKLKELQGMKGVVVEYDNAQKALKAKDGAGDEMKVLCSAKQEEVNVVSKKIGVVKNELEKLDKLRDAQKGKVQPLRDEHSAVKKMIDDKYTELKAMRAKWKKDNDKFYDHMGEVKRITALLRKQEDELLRKEREEEQERREKEEEAQKPWLKEIALCNHLITYLQLCQPSAGGAGGAGGGAAAAPVVAKTSMKKKDNDEDLFGATKKKKKRKKKKEATSNTTAKHDFNSLNSFAQLKKHSGLPLEAPSTVSQIDETVVLLEAIKAHYDTRPREKKIKKKKSSSSGGKGGESKSSNEKGSTLTTPYGDATVKKSRRDGVVVAKLPWGQIFIKA